MRASTRASLRAVGLEPDDVARVVIQALAEDLGGGEDVTSAATIPSGSVTTADYVIRQSGVIAGLPVLAATLELGLGHDVEYSLAAADGDVVSKGDVIATVTAGSAELLTVERTSLNLMCRMSGIATLTRSWVDAISGTDARLRDTRKTTPGLRHLEKYAVRCGGGVNHRIGLFDAVLIKDNHVVAAGGVAQALDAVWRYLGGRTMTVQCEIDRLSQLNEALEHGATEILLDNMSTDDMAEAVRYVRGKLPERQTRSERRPESGSRPPCRRNGCRLPGCWRADALGASSRHRARRTRGLSRYSRLGGPVVMVVPSGRVMVSVRPGASLSSQPFWWMRVWCCWQTGIRLSRSVAPPCRHQVMWWILQRV